MALKVFISEMETTIWARTLRCCCCCAGVLTRHAGGRLAKQDRLLPAARGFQLKSACAGRGSSELQLLVAQCRYSDQTQWPGRALWLLEPGGRPWGTGDGFEK